MNTNNANTINTGLAAKIDEFRWFHPNSTVHVEGVKFSEPDFTIPPTPVSSYSNLHVVLDTVHPSTETITRGVATQLPYGIQRSSLATGYNFAQPLQKPLSPEPASLLNRTRGFPSNFKAVPDVIDPEQPGARANESLTSLKSEVAPLLPPMVPLESFDDELAERTDRALPAAVDIGLVDESASLPFTDDIRHKNWNLRHRTFGGRYANQWKAVGADINKRNWNLKPRFGGQYSKQWKMVGDDIGNKRFNLRRSRVPDNFRIKSWALLGKLEEAERSRRLSSGVDPLWSGRMYQVGREIQSSILPMGWSTWLSNLKNKVIDRSMDAIDSAKDAVRDIADSLPVTTTSMPVEPLDTSFSFGSELYSISLPRQIPYDIIKLEEEERADRIARGVDVIAYQRWNDLLLQPHKTLSPEHAYLADATNVASGVLSSAKEVLSESSKGWTGLFNSIAHSVADEAHYLADAYKHSHLLDSAKETLGMSGPSSLSSISKAEEAERLRRSNAKVDPMMAARIGRVQDELLKTVKSV